MYLFTLICFKQLYSTFRLLTECTLDSITKLITLRFLSNTSVVTFTYCLYALELYNCEWWKWKVLIKRGYLFENDHSIGSHSLLSQLIFSLWHQLYLLTCSARFWSILFVLVVDYWFIHQSSSIHSLSRNLRYATIAYRIQGKEVGDDWWVHCLDLIIDSSIQSVLGKKRRCKRSKGVLKQPLVVPQSSWRVVYQPANLKKSNVYVAKLIHHRLYVWLIVLLSYSFCDVFFHHFNCILSCILFCVCWVIPFTINSVYVLCRC